MKRVWPKIKKRYQKNFFSFKTFQRNYFNKNTILVHCVEVEKEELKLIKTKKVNLVLCPRSNLNISGKLPNIKEIVKLKIPFAIGTDSLASDEKFCPEHWTFG